MRVEIQVSKPINLDLLSEIITNYSWIEYRPDENKIIAEVENMQEFINAVRRLETNEDAVIIEKLKTDPNWRKFDREVAKILDKSESKRLGIFIRKKHLDAIRTSEQGRQSGRVRIRSKHDTG